MLNRGGGPAERRGVSTVPAVPATTEARRTRSWLALVSALCIAGMAACGGSDGSTSPATSVAAAPASTQAASSQATTQPDAPTSAPAASSALPIFPVNARPYGRSYPEWVAAWWQWSISQPRTGHPLDQSGDVDCGVARQGEDVWFLGGVVTVSGTLTRRCTIPPDVALFFPVLNSECSTLEQPPFYGSDEPTLRACTEAISLANLQASIDGAEVPPGTLAEFVVTSPMFALEVPAENILLVPGPTTGQSVSSGVHLLLPPLPAGSHVVRFGGDFADFDVEQDITYEITVEG